MAKKKSFLQTMGVFKPKPKPRGRPPTQYRTKIEWKVPSTTLVGKKKKSTFKLTKRKKKIAISNLEGGGIGFVVGGTLGGLGGMMIGFPIGVVAGNIYGKYKAGKPRGRPRKIIPKKKKR